MRDTSYKVAIAIALLLLAAGFAVAAGENTNETDVTVEEAAPDGLAVLDPGEVHASILEGQPFEVPTPSGSVLVEATDRVQESIEYRSSPGEPYTERAPNVWHVEPVQSDGVGLVLSFNHTLSAWVATPSEGTHVEPLLGEPGATEDSLYQVQAGDPMDAPSSVGFGILSHIQEYRDVYAYVDTEFEAEHGSCCWADEIVWTLSKLNTFFQDVQLEFTYLSGTVDTDFNSHDIDDAFSTLIGKSWNGADIRSHFSYKDFDDCHWAKAELPGDTFVIQHESSSCHFDQVPTTDAQRAYVTANPLGMNMNAHPDHHWSETEDGHEHRSIMKPSLWGHFHTCFSQENLNRMSSYLGTNVIGTACEDT